MYTVGQSQMLYVEGPWACFTRPEFKAERVSYDLITPSAARALFEAVYWKPAFRWEVGAIEVVRRGRLVPLGGRCEVSGKAPSATAVLRALRGGQSLPGLDSASQRVLRSTLALREVAYRLTASIRLTDAAVAAGDHPGKHQAIFARRAAAGQAFHHPYLGQRELAVRRFELVTRQSQGDSAAPACNWNEDLGPMFYDFDYADGATPLVYFPRIEAGCVAVPPLDAVRAAGTSAACGALP